MYILVICKNKFYKEAYFSYKTFNRFSKHTFKLCLYSSEITASGPGHGGGGWQLHPHHREYMIRVDLNMLLTICYYF